MILILFMKDLNEYSWFFIFFKKKIFYFFFKKKIMYMYINLYKKNYINKKINLKIINHYVFIHKNIFYHLPTMDNLFWFKQHNNHILFYFSIIFKIILLNQSFHPIPTKVFHYILLYIFIYYRSKFLIDHSLFHTMP